MIRTTLAKGSPAGDEGGLRGCASPSSLLPPSVRELLDLVTWRSLGEAAGALGLLPALAWLFLGLD